MAEKTEGQQILEQLATARHEAMMWSTPIIQPSQTPMMLSGGMAGAADHPGGVNLAAIQQQQALEIQNATMQQMYLKSYSQGTPGVMSPVQSMANPIAANYQLQNMYMMNPYMANFLSGNSGGGVGGMGGMNLAPAQMMTSPQMGIFRNGRFDRPGSPSGLGGVVRDWATAADLRSFAPYEDPLDEKIEARRRMLRRGENWGAGAIAAAVSVGSFTQGGPIGLAVGLMAEPALDVATSAYFQRRGEAEQIYDISKRISTGSNAHGFRNKGFSLDESNQLMKGFRKEAAASPFYNMGDYMQVLDKGSQAGLYNFAGGSKNTEGKTKEIIGMIDVFMRLAGDPDVKSAIERMGTLQTMGLNTGQMKGALANIKASANLAGTSVDAIMATSGAYGAQMAVAMGGPASFGLGVGAHAQAMAAGVAQQGVYNPLQLSSRGGKEGLTQSLTQSLTNNIYSELGTNVAAFTRQVSPGKFEIDQDAFNKWKSTGEVPGGSDQLIKATMSNLGTFKGHMPEFLASQKDLTAQLASGMTNLDHLMVMNRQVAEFRKINPGFITEDMGWQHFYGEDWKAAKSRGSAEGIDFAQIQQIQVSRTVASGEQNKYIRSRSIFSQASTWASGLYNSTINTISPLEFMAEYEHKLGARAAKEMYIYGLDYTHSAGGGMAGLKKAGYGQENAAPGKIPYATNRAPVSDEDIHAKLRQSGDLSTYMAETNPETATVGDALFRHTGWGDTPGRRAEEKQRLKDLKSLSSIMLQTGTETASLSDNDKTSANAKFFVGSGKSTTFKIGDFVASKDFDDAQKSRYLNSIRDDKSPESGDRANAVEQHVDFQRRLNEAKLEYSADRQRQLLDGLREKGISPKLAREVAELGSMIGENTKTQTPESLAALQASVLSPNHNNTESGVRARLLEAVSPDAGGGFYANVLAKAGSVKKLAMSEGADLKVLQDKTLIQQSNESATIGDTVLKTAQAMARMTPPSMFGSTSDLANYANAETEQMKERHFKDLKESGDSEAGKAKDAKEYYESTDKGKQYAAQANTEATARSVDRQGVTGQGLDSNPQLSEKQNLRRIASAVEATQVILSRLDQKLVGSNKFFTG